METQQPPNDPIIAQPEEKPVSFSQLSMFERCGVQWYNRYVLKRRVPPGVALVRGSAVHRPIEQNMRHKLETGSLLQADVIADMARDAVVERIDQDGLTVDDPEFAGKSEKQVTDTIKDHAVSLTLCHHETIAPSIDPDIVEEKIEASEPQFGLRIVAKLDLATKDGFIRDTKTAGKSPAANDADDSMQLTIYDYAYRVKTGKIPKGMALDVLVRTPKQGKVYAKTLTTNPRPKSYFEMLFHRLNAFNKATKAGIFHPAPSGSWQCSQRFCGYWGTCPFSQK